MFVVEKGEKLSNSTSYAGVDCFNGYTSIRMGYEHFHPNDGCAHTDAQIQRALVTASDIVDRQNWSGNKSSKMQNMQWPRCGAINSCSSCECPCPDSIPKEIKEATIILAAMILDGSYDISHNSVNAKIKSASFMDMSFEFAGGGAVINGSAGCGDGISTVSSDKLFAIRHLINCFLDGRSGSIKFVRGY